MSRIQMHFVEGSANRAEAKTKEIDAGVAGAKLRCGLLRAG